MYTKTSSESVRAVCVDQQFYQFLLNGRHCNNITLSKTPYRYRKLKLLNIEDLPTLFMFNAQALKSAEENFLRPFISLFKNQKEWFQFQVLEKSNCAPCVQPVQFEQICFRTAGTTQICTFYNSG